MPILLAPLLLCRAAAARAPTYEQRAHLPRAAHALQAWLLVLVGGLLLLLLGGAAGCAGGALILRGRRLSLLALVPCWAAHGRRRGLSYSHMPLLLLRRRRGPAAPCRWLGSTSSRLRGPIAAAQLVFIQHAIAVGTQQRGGLPAGAGRLDVARRWRPRRLWGAAALAASPTPAGAGSGPHPRWHGVVTATGWAGTQRGLRGLGQLGWAGSCPPPLLQRSRRPHRKEPDVAPRGLPTAESHPNLPTPALASTPPEAPRGPAPDGILVPSIAPRKCSLQEG